MKKTKMRMEGFTLTVKDVSRSVEFYTEKLGFSCDWNAAPHFAMLRVGGPEGKVTVKNSAKRTTSPKKK